MSATSVRRTSAMLAIALAGTAAASASGCTYTDFPYAYVCANVNGKGLHLDSVDVIRAKWNGSSIRDYQALVTVQEKDGQRYEYWSPVYNEKHFGRVVVTLLFDNWFDDGSKICASFLESGTIQDTVCKKIHR